MRRGRSFRWDVPGTMLRYAPPMQGLSPREREIARLVALGKSNREIAAQLRLSVRTVENYLYTAYAKLGITKRIELALIVMNRTAPVSLQKVS